MGNVIDIRSNGRFKRRAPVDLQVMWRERLLPMMREMVKDEPGIETKEQAMIVLTQMLAGITMARLETSTSTRLALARPWLRMNEKMRSYLHDYHALMQEVSDEMLEETAKGFSETDPDKVKP